MKADDEASKPPSGENQYQELTFKDLAANQKLAAQLLKEQNLLAQVGEQKYYKLPKDAAEQLLSGQPNGAAEDFSLTRVWCRTASEPDNQQDDALLAEIAARLQDSVDSNLEFTSNNKAIDWQYGDEIYILSNSTAVDEFIKNLPCSPSGGEFSKTQFWTKPEMIRDSKQEKLLEEICNRLRIIEERLLRLERHFNPDRPVTP